MQIKKSTLNNLLIGVCSVVLIVFLIVIFSNRSSTSNQNGSNPVSFVGDVQIIEVKAKGGYSPSVINAQANKETILRVTTNNTFDCSSAFTMPKLRINQLLPPSGKTDFKISPQPAGSEIEGTCSMGMYGFTIKFN